jgi:endonuclease YncB( thermonuclease family)
MIDWALAACVVIAVSDGDTLTTRCVSGQEKVHVQIRLAEVDAPELGQAYGRRSKRHLSDICFNKAANVRALSHDRYGRTVARVVCAGTDAGAAQVAAGMAWVFDRYVEDRRLYDVQHEAKAAGRGLWSERSPLPPWEWRQRKQSDRS